MTTCLSSPVWRVLLSIIPTVIFSAPCWLGMQFVTWGWHQEVMYVRPRHSSALVPVLNQLRSLLWKWIKATDLKSSPYKEVWTYFLCCLMKSKESECSSQGQHVSTGFRPPETVQKRWTHGRSMCFTIQTELLTHYSTQFLHTDNTTKSFSIDAS